MLQLEKYLSVGEVLAHLAPGSLIVGIAALVFGVSPAVLTNALGVLLFLLISYLVGVLLDVLHRALMSRPRLRRKPDHTRLHESLHTPGQRLLHWMEERLGDDPSLWVTEMLAELRRRNEQTASHIGEQLEIGNLVVNAGLSLALVGLIGLVGTPHLRGSISRSTDEVATMWSGRASKTSVGGLQFAREGDYPRGDPCQRAAWVAARRVWGSSRAEGCRKHPGSAIRFATNLPAHVGPAPSDSLEEKSFVLSADELQELDRLKTRERVEVLRLHFAELSRCPYCYSAGKLPRSREGDRGYWPRRPHRHGLLWRAFVMSPGELEYYVFTRSPEAAGARSGEPALPTDPKDDSRLLAKVAMAGYRDTCAAQDLTSPYEMSELHVPGADAMTTGNFSSNEGKVLARAEAQLAAGAFLVPGLVLSFFLGAGCYIVGRNRVAWLLSNLLHQGLTHGMGPGEPPSSEAQGGISVDS